MLNFLYVEELLLWHNRAAQEQQHYSDITVPMSGESMGEEIETETDCSLQNLDTSRESKSMAFKVYNVLRRRRSCLTSHILSARTQLQSGSPHIIGRLKNVFDITAHYSCVNSIKWNKEGSLLASGGDDRTLVITKYPELTTPTIIETGHVANIFCVGFLPNRSNWVATCSGDHQIRLFDIETKKLLSVFEGHQGRVKKFVIPLCNSSYSLYSCSDDGTIKLWDLLARPPTYHRRSTPIYHLEQTFLDDPSVFFHRRSSHMPQVQRMQCWTPLYSYSHTLNTVTTFRDSALSRPQAITSIAVAEQKPEYLVIGGHLPSIWLLDRRMMGCGIHEPQPVAQFQPAGRPRCLKTTGVNISYDGSRVLGSWSGEYIYQFSTSNSSTTTVLYDYLNRIEQCNFSQHTRSSNLSKLDHHCINTHEEISSKELSSKRRRENCIMNNDNLRFILKKKKLPLPRHNHNQNFDEYLKNSHFLFIEETNDDSICNHSTQQKHLTDTHQNTHYISLPKKPSLLKSVQKNYRKNFLTDYRGHCNIHTVKDVQYLGPYSNWVASGSDDGRFFIWDASAGRLRFIAHSADSTIVNCISEHPSYTALATSGIDETIKIWRPGGLTRKLNFDFAFVRQILKKNEKRRQSIPRPFLHLRNRNDTAMSISD